MELKQVRRRVLAHWEKLRELRKEWESLNDSSRTQATLLVNTVLEREFLEIEQSWSRLLDSESAQFPHLLERLEGKIWNRVAKISKTLSGQLDELGDILSKMRMLVVALDEICLGEIKTESSNSLDAVSEVVDFPLFLVSPPSAFAELARELVDMYSKELAMKGAMAEDMASGAVGRTALTAYLTAWTVQVYVDEERIAEMDELVKTESVLATAA